MIPAWLLLPATFLGLIVGALVAFVIVATMSPKRPMAEPRVWTGDIPHDLLDDLEPLSPEQLLRDLNQEGR